MDTKTTDTDFKFVMKVTFIVYCTQFNSYVGSLQFMTEYLTT